MLNTVTDTSVNTKCNFHCYWQPPSSLGKGFEVRVDLYIHVTGWEFGSVKFSKTPLRKKKPKLDLRSCNSWFLNILCIIVTIPLLLGQLFSFTMLAVPQRQNRCFVVTCLFGGRLPWQSWHWAESFYRSGATSTWSLQKKCAHRWQHLPYPTPHHSSSS